MRYRIRVQGHLDPGWQDRLERLPIAHLDCGATLLSGTLPDQVALHGLLLEIVRLVFTLLSLESDEVSQSNESTISPKEHTREVEMGKVLLGLSVSLDGFIADKDGDPSLVFAWMGRDMEQLHAVVGDSLSETGVVIMGHRSFDQIDSEHGWVFPDGTAPEWPVIVLQSQQRDPVKKGRTQFYFETGGVESAVKKAQELAGEKHVALHGASSVQQALRARLLDELHVSVAHVLLGEGVRLFDHLGGEPIRLQHLRTLDTPGATHLSFRVVK